MSIIYKEAREITKDDLNGYTAVSMIVNGEFTGFWCPVNNVYVVMLLDGFSFAGVDYYDVTVRSAFDISRNHETSSRFDSADDAIKYLNKKVSYYESIQ